MSPTVARQTGVLRSFSARSGAFSPPPQSSSAFPSLRDRPSNGVAA